MSLLLDAGAPSGALLCHSPGLSFTPPDEKAVIELRERLKENSVGPTGTGPVRSTRSFDDSESLPEATWPKP
ncbi:MAG: hypothetical protein AVDCRST_MAG01-01-1898 [uncultured Rubrobacteraceae bacterium]|uniref:Uncharacterized protein n=1 Tax=uncultured Rubrobacteraceae bacterium TaxID=349277 RepID=A0A6J4PK29_9ACTN|nr:MAG: hypothetical protein AVDCRST_MAG01-01-1898 [uncultured Rubrobacteraceae bacterium]